MKRREFLRSMAMVCAAVGLPKAGRLFGKHPSEETWRKFEVTTRVEVLKPSGVTRVWLPAAMIRNTKFQRTLSNHFSAERGNAEMVEIKPEALGIVYATFPSGVRPVVTLSSKVALRNYAVDLSTAGQAPRVERTELQFFLQPTKLAPTDGIVKATATEITRRSKTDVDKARASL